MKHRYSFLLLFLSLILLLCACGSRSYEDGFADGYQAGYQAALNSAQPTTLPEPTPSPVTTEPPPETKPRPLNGTIALGHSYDDDTDSEITVHASSTDCVVKIKTADGSTVITFYVRAGESVTVGVPPKILYVFFAQGEQWYGWGDFFGEDTDYSKDPEPVDFSEYTIEYTLYEVAGGNLSLDEIDPEAF